MCVAWCQLGGEEGEACNSFVVIYLRAEVGNYIADGMIATLLPFRFWVHVLFVGVVSCLGMSSCYTVENGFSFGRKFSWVVLFGYFM